MPILSKTRWLLPALVAVAVALQAPAAFGADSRGAEEIAKLIEDLGSEAGHLNVASAMALGKLFDAKNPNRPAEGLEGVVQALAKRVQADIAGPNAMVIRVSCVDALGRIRAASCVPPLKWAFNNGDAETALAAADSLKRALPAAEVAKLMRSSLSTGGPAARAAAARYIAPVAGPEDIAALGTALSQSTEKDDWRTRERCADALAILARKGHKLPVGVCEALIAVQADPIRNVVETSATALRAALKKSRGDLLPVLARAAVKEDDAENKADRTWHVREFAITLLGEAGMPDIKGHLPAIIAGLGDGTLNVTRAARKALGRLPKDTLIPLLTDALKTNASPNIRAGALEMIGSVPAGAHTAATAELARTLLKESGKDESEARLRAAAITFLGSAGIVKAAPDIAEGVGDDSATVRRAAVTALKKLKIEKDTDRAAVVAVLVRALADEDADKDWREAASAATALGGCPHADAIEPLILHGLTNTVLNVQDASTKALIQYGKDRAMKANVEKTLLAIAGDDDGSGTWEFGAVVFGELRTKTAVPMLVRMLSEPPEGDEKNHWRVQVHAADALGAIGEKGAAVSAALRVCAKSRILQVQGAANRALEALGAE